jgi:hypothetical protein
VGGTKCRTRRRFNADHVGRSGGIAIHGDLCHGCESGIDIRGVNGLKKIISTIIYQKD